MKSVYSSQPSDNGADYVLRVRDVMTEEFVSLKPDLEINIAMRALLDNKITSAPVVDDQGELVGILSLYNCIEAFGQAQSSNHWNGRVAEYMKVRIITLDYELPIRETITVFLKHPYHSFPVMQGYRLVGKVSQCDLVEPLARESYQKMHKI